MVPGVPGRNGIGFSLYENTGGETYEIRVKNLHLIEKRSRKMD